MADGLLADRPPVFNIFREDVWDELEEMVGILSLDDGQKSDISVRDPEVYMRLVPMTKIVANLELTNSKYGMMLSIKDIIEIGNAI